MASMEKRRCRVVGDEVNGAGAVMGHIVWGPIDPCEDVDLDHEEIKSYCGAFIRGKT